MTEAHWESVWERVRSGAHTLIVGAASIPPAPSDLKALRVNCDAFGTTGGALDEAHRRVKQLLGEGLPSVGGSFRQTPPGLRHRLLEQTPGRSIDVVLVEECNRLADWSDGRAVLLLESIDAADAATIETLLQILRRPGWLRLPLVLSARGALRGALAALADCLRGAQGNQAVIEFPADASRPPPAFDWTRLPPDALRVLRAGAVLGTTFEVDLLARLLDESPGVVLDVLQYAADTGAPLADRGEGRFSLPAEAVETLQSKTLPSLLSFWRERLGELLSSRQPSVTKEPLERSAQAAAETQQRPLGYEELFEAARPIRPQSGPSAGEAGRPGTQPSAQPAPAQEPAPGSRPPEDPARAAAYLQSAGQTDAAVERYLTAVREAAAGGDARRALWLAGEGLKLLDGLPNSERRGLLRAQLLLETGRLQWHGAALGASYTLQQALQSLEAARASLPAAVPPELAGDLAAVAAGICYDLGDLDSLEQALAELTGASQRLLEAGQPVLAARLLNDQAAIYVRLGDPVRATHLLSKSRELFERLLRDNPDDSAATMELAETEHLLARLPLHARIRSGREDDAYAKSLDHALAAERVYRNLGQRRELAHVWETMGRVELQRGRLEAAGKRLSAALELQRGIGDVTGLARSTAAFADLFIAAGRLEEAASLLGSSVALNAEKGSPIGLAFNRRALAALSQAAAAGPQGEQVRGALKTIEDRLSQAEAMLGRLVLPGETG